MRPSHLLPIALLVSLLTSGCERALFAFLNRKSPPPERSLTYAPELGLGMDIYAPRAATGPVPVVVFFYGGAWQRGQRSQYRFVGRRLAENGVLAIVADYRTYPRTTFPGFMDDAARAVARVHAQAAQWGGDPRRLFVAGHSAGAHIAALLATDPRYLRRQGLSPKDLRGVIGLSGPYDFSITGDLRQVFGPQAQWPQAQPVNFVDGDEPPFLLEHGLRDRVVESKDSVELAQKLKAHGVEAELILLPQGTHSAPLAAIYDPKREPAVLAGMLNFIRGGDAGPR